MNLLYLNHYAGTPALGMEFRPYYLAREWVRHNALFTPCVERFVERLAQLGKESA
jgi:hypothetical protein